MVWVGLAAAVVYGFTAGFVLRADLRARPNRLFALACVLLAVWAAGASLWIGAADQPTAWRWFRIAALGWTLGPPVISHFFESFVARGETPARRALRAGLYVTGAAFFLINTRTRLLNAELVRVASGWNYVVARPPLPLVYDAFVAVCLLPGLYRLRAWAGRSEQRSRRAQAWVIAASGLVTLALLYACDRGPHLLGVTAVPSTVHVLMLGWMAGIAHAVARHGLFDLTPELAAQNIFRASAEALVLVARDDRILRVNAAAESLLAAPERQLLGRTFRDLFPGEPLFERELLASFRAGRAVVDHEIATTRAGETAVLSLSLSVVMDPFGHEAGFLAVLRDVTERKRAEADLYHRATHDPLTGLFNRAALADRLREALARARRSGGQVAVAIIDLDRFKDINDTLGHDAGDAALRAVADRIRGVLRDTDCVARLGGDEFAVVLPDMPAAGHAAGVAARLIAALAPPVDIGGVERSVGASIGASVFPGDASDGDALMKCADLALYAAKAAGRNCYRQFSRAVVS